MQAVNMAALRMWKEGGLATRGIHADNRTVACEVVVVAELSPMIPARRRPGYDGNVSEPEPKGPAADGPELSTIHQFNLD